MMHQVLAPTLYWLYAVAAQRDRLRISLGTGHSHQFVSETMDAVYFSIAVAKATRWVRRLQRFLNGDGWSVLMQRWNHPSRDECLDEAAIRDQIAAAAVDSARVMDFLDACSDEEKLVRDMLEHDGDYLLGTGRRQQEEFKATKWHDAEVEVTAHIIVTESEDRILIGGRLSVQDATERCRTLSEHLHQCWQRLDPTVWKQFQAPAAMIDEVNAAHGSQG